MIVPGQIQQCFGPNLEMIIVKQGHHLRPHRLIGCSAQNRNGLLAYVRRRMFQQIPDGGMCPQLLAHFEKSQRVENLVLVGRTQFLSKDAGGELIQDWDRDPLRLDSDTPDVVPQRCDVLLLRHEGGAEPDDEQDKIHPTDLSGSEAQGRSK